MSKKFLLIVFSLLIFLIGCFPANKYINVSGVLLSPEERKNLCGYVFTRGFDAAGMTFTNRIMVGPRFSESDKRIARTCSKYTLTFAGTNFNVDFSQYYWATNIPDKFWGLTYGPKKKHGFVLINPKTFPTDSSTNKMFDFGYILNHEWLHLKYGLNHKQISDLHDGPATKAWYDL